MNDERNFDVEATVLLYSMAIKYSKTKLDKHDGNQLGKIESLTDELLEKYKVRVGVQIRDGAESEWIDDGIESESVTILRDYLYVYSDVDPKNVRLTVIYDVGDEEE